MSINSAASHISGLVSNLGTASEGVRLSRVSRMVKQFIRRVDDSILEL
jgi:hypothetical protein